MLLAFFGHVHVRLPKGWRRVAHDQREELRDRHLDLGLLSPLLQRVEHGVEARVEGVHDPHISLDLAAVDLAHELLKIVREAQPRRVDLVQLLVRGHDLTKLIEERRACGRGDVGNRDALDPDEQDEDLIGALGMVDPLGELADDLVEPRSRQMAEHRGPRGHRAL